MNCIDDDKKYETFGEIMQDCTFIYSGNRVATYIYIRFSLRKKPMQTPKKKGFIKLE